jgi:hypothetical protein
MSNQWQNSFDRHLVLHQMSVLIKSEKDKLSLLSINYDFDRREDNGLDLVSYHTGRLWALEDLRAQIETNNKIIEVI